MFQRLFRDVRAPTHILVRAVRAGADQADLDLVWPTVLLGSITWTQLLAI